MNNQLSESFEEDEYMDVSEVRDDSISSFDFEVVGDTTDDLLLLEESKNIVVTPMEAKPSSSLQSVSSHELDSDGQSNQDTEENRSPSTDTDEELTPDESKIMRFKFEEVDVEAEVDPDMYNARLDKNA